MPLSSTSQIVSGVILLLFALIFAVIAYFLKRYIDKQDESIKSLQAENKEMVRKFYQEKETLLKEILEKDAYIGQRVERRVKIADCECQGEEIKRRFDTGDNLFEEIKICLKGLNKQMGESLQGIHQYSLIMSSTMLALCKNFGDNVECRELEELHMALQRQKIQHIVNQVEKKNDSRN